MPSFAAADTKTAEISVGRRPEFTLKHLNFICWGMFLAFLVIPLAMVVKNGFQGRGPAIGGDKDFVFFYTMGRMLNEHSPAQLYNVDLQKKIEMEVQPLTDGREYTPNPYHPYIAILFRPFALFSFNAAYRLWLFTSFCLYLSGLALITRRFLPHDPYWRSLAFCFALAFLPFLWIMTGGQIPTIGFIGLALACYEEDRGHPFLSGLGLSLCLYKPPLLALLLPMLLIGKRYKTLIGFLGGGVAMAAVTTAAEGFGIWSGYFRLLLSFGSAAARTQGYRQLRYYMDLSAFSSLLPGGRSWLGISILVILACCAFGALAAAWRKDSGATRASGILLWAATITWTLVLNVYSPIYDSILAVIGIIMTAAVLKDLADLRLRRLFNVIWILVLIGSWVTVQIAQTTGFQVFTVLFVLLGTVQIIAWRRINTAQPATICR